MTARPLRDCVALNAPARKTPDCVPPSGERAPVRRTLLRLASTVDPTRIVRCRVSRRSVRCGPP